MIYLSASLIDKNNGVDFPSSILTMSWKENHELIPAVKNYQQAVSESGLTGWLRKQAFWVKPQASC